VSGCCSMFRREAIVVLVVFGCATLRRRRLSWRLALHSSLRFPSTPQSTQPTYPAHINRDFARSHRQYTASRQLTPSCSPRSAAPLQGHVGEADALTTTSGVLSAFHAKDIVRASRTTTFTITMAANGTLIPPPRSSASTSPSLAKRKHAAASSIVSNGASVSAQGQPAPRGPYTLQTVLGDIFDVLKRYA
jgi:hypothetical protein